MAEILKTFTHSGKYKQKLSISRAENTPCISPSNGLPLCHQGISQRVTTAKNKAITYLKHELAHISDDYILAMTTYALTLAADPAASSAFTRLLNDAVVKGSLGVVC